MNEDMWEESCEWCRDFVNGECVREEESPTINIIKRYEESDILELIKRSTEKVGTELFENFMYLLNSFNLSEKEQETIKEELVEGLHEYNQLLTETMETYVNELQEELLDSMKYRAGIHNPEEYSCKHWR